MTVRSDAIASRRTLASPSIRVGRTGFTIVEAMIALSVLTIFLVTSTMALNLFDTRARPKNATRKQPAPLVDDYVSYPVG